MESKTAVSVIGIEVAHQVYDPKLQASVGAEVWKQQETASLCFPVHVPSFRLVMEAPALAVVVAVGLGERRKSWGTLFLVQAMVAT